MTELGQLHRKRGIFKRKLTALKTFCDSIDPSEQITAERRELIEAKFNSSATLLEEFQEIQSQIEIICSDEDLDAECLEGTDFDTKYFSVTIALKGLLKTSETNNTPLNASDAVIVNSVQLPPRVPLLENIKLPTINLPKFSGSYTEWLEFKETFESLIHENPSLSTIQKFHYLRASVVGAAAKVIQKLNFSSEEYSMAWNLLCSRYSNNDILILNHIKAIFDLQKTVSGDSKVFRNFTDEIAKHINYLSKLGNEEQQRDAILIYIITSKFDRLSARDWEDEARQKGNNLKNLELFLNSKAEIFEKLEQRNIGQCTPNYNQRGEKTAPGKQSFLASSLKCPHCNSDNSHAIYQCVGFLKLSPRERLDRVRKLKLCQNCLRSHSNTCTSSGCRVCSYKHNTLLHFDTERSQAEKHSYTPKATLPVANNTSESQFQPGPSQVFNSLNNPSTQTLLSTVNLWVTDARGQKHHCRALLDCGSQSHFMTYEFFKRLGLHSSPANISVIGITNTPATIHHKCDVGIHSKYNNYYSEIQCLLVPVINKGIPCNHIDITKLSLPDHITLADDTFHEPSEINLIIGAGLFWNILRKGKISLGYGLFLNNTVFGWVMAGNLPGQSQQLTQCNFLHSKDALQVSMQKFWEVEEVKGASVTLTIDEKECEEQFNKTVSRNPEGRFVVGIPFKESPIVLGNSKQTTLKRFYHLETKLQRNSDLKCQYIEFMSDYVKLGHMTEISEPINDSECFYLPHHAVLKPNNLTTKCRVVFDGSQKTDTGYSLNSIQHIGPVVQDDLLSILLRFRQHTYVFSADISKMYRQIEVLPENRKFQRIFWRDDPFAELKTYELNTVTYGTASGPYLATRCLKQLANENENSYPQAANIISRDFYIDDLISGFSGDLVNGSLLCKHVSDILNTAGFELHKWCSNNPLVLQHIQITDSPAYLIQFGDCTETKLLGLQWSFVADSLTYHISIENTISGVTKRSMLSEICKLFDPLGLLAPTIIIPKMLIQELWLLKTDWDDNVPENIKQKWLKFKNELYHLNSLHIPRLVLSNKTMHSIQLHGFCDASQNAYGCAVYARSVDSDNNITMNLICAKGKVAPLKVLSIPRLELSSALLLARLMNKIKTSLTIEVDCHYWTDSQVVLCWLNMHSKLLQVFVSNRVSEIQELTPAHKWRHIRSYDNPADLITRGAQAIDLIHCTLWWQGPTWMSLPDTLWPKGNESCTVQKDVPELKRDILTTFIASEKSEFLCERYSSLNKIIRITAWCLRFIKNCQGKVRNQSLQLSKSLSNEEMQGALCKIISTTQSTTFTEVISLIQANKQLPNKHPLSNFAPFVDTQGILRVGGRLKHSNLSFEQSHPILLTSKCALSKLIFNQEHINLKHSGPQLLLYTVRQRFWVIGGRTLARKIVHECITCFRANPKSVTPQMGNLPLQRVQPTYPFASTITDYAGPFYIKEKQGRGKRLYKCYICLFMCMSTKAIHVEIVTDLTSESFLAVLKRFIARRGQPTDIFSDNGKTYVGAQSELHDIGVFVQNNQTKLQNVASARGIHWHFIPAYAPNFNGLVEGGVKSVKHHLKRVVQNTSLTIEQFITVLTEIEGILNSRPLSPMSSDPNDYQPLTPAHFLIGRPITTIIEPDVRHIKPARLSNYQHLEQMKQHFWERWQKEYISGLQLRTKWKQLTQNIELNTLVLIKEDNLPPQRWKLGRVSQLHPGSDGIVRVISIKTQAGVIKRATSRVCPLPFKITDSENQ